METLARFIISAVELGEAEGRMLRREFVRLAVTFSLIIITLLAGIAGLSLLSWGIFKGLSLSMGPTWASVLLGLLWIAMTYLLTRVVKARF